MPTPTEDYSTAIEQIQSGAVADGVRLLAATVPSLPPPRATEARSNLGTALSMLGRKAEAEAQYATALRARPGHALLSFNLGVLCAEMRRAAEAEAHYRRAVRDDPHMATAYNNLGNLAREQSRVDEARAHYRGALAADPAHAQAHNNLANVLKGDERSGEAAAAYATAVRLAPAYPEAYKNLGNLLKERPRLRPAAVRAYRTALSLLPTHREVFLNLGETLQWLGRHRAANATYALAVARGVWEHAQQRPSLYVTRSNLRIAYVASLHRAGCRDRYAPGLEQMAWWPPARLPWVARLLDGVDVLMEEGLALLRGRRDFLQYMSPALTNGSWADVTLQVSGARQGGSRLAPRSRVMRDQNQHPRPSVRAGGAAASRGRYALLRSLGADVGTMVSGSAYFSRMGARSHLRAHCGPTNTRLRVHVGLSVPAGARMRVGNETRAWVERRAFVFDDSFEHEVWNDSDEDRLVFIVDGWHPALATDAQRCARRIEGCTAARHTARRVPCLEHLALPSRRAALDGDGLVRYERALLNAAAAQGDPPVQEDILADRRRKVIY
jgi:Flp pilus assembly protein TadD